MEFSINKEHYRQALKIELDASYHDLTVAINRLLKKDVKPINAKDLMAFPLNTWIEIGPNIKARKRKNRFKDYLSFDIDMQKNACFAEHFHGDVVESTEVIKGEMLDTATVPNTIYKKGDVAHWEKNVKHTPVALEKTFLHVLFKRK
ncbi:hypothetical protein OAQ15_04495 [Flavobacteriaceae bacterium]|nr:hypothetical protein [Flavobacteriaceae bacterium]